VGYAGVSLTVSERKSRLPFTSPWRTRRADRAPGRTVLKQKAESPRRDPHDATPWQRTRARQAPERSLPLLQRCRRLDDARPAPRYAKSRALVRPA